MNDRAIIRSFETGQGRRLAILALAVTLIALVIGIVAFGFRDRHIRRGADALTQPLEETSHTHAKVPDPAP